MAKGEPLTEKPKRERGYSLARWPLLLAVLTLLAFVPSSEAGVGAGTAALVAVFLFSPRRERDVGLLLLVVGLGVLVAARSFYPGLGSLLAALYLLGRDWWGSGGSSGVPPIPRRVGRVSPSRRAKEGVGPGSGLWSNRTLYELVTALGAVALVVALLQQGTAAWPAMVAVESCSMEPNVRVGDLVLVVGPVRSAIATQEGDLIRVGREVGAPEGAAPWVGDHGARESGLSVGVVSGGGAGDRSFALTSGCTAERADRGGCGVRGEPLGGAVIVFYPNGNSACTPIIHRARAWIPDNSSYGGRTFARGGFITKGDNNGPLGGDPSRAADQIANAAGRGGACLNSEPVQPEWLVGVAKFRVPWLGYVRLLFGNWPRSCATGL